MPRLVLAALAAFLLVVPEAGAAVSKRFYTAPEPLPGTAHGDLIRNGPLPRAAGLDGARSNRVLLYRSTGIDGKPVAVSASLALPRGKPPEGGWPLITYAHGTTGIADKCAPSRIGLDNPLPASTTYANDLLERWLARGWAVVRTDYEGLGTPGAHPYLVGSSEARSVLDAARAARDADGGIGSRIAIAGHSQGGHGALFAAALAPRYTPELKLRGTVALAPASRLDEQAALITSLDSPGGFLTALVASILRGSELDQPSLKIASQLTPAAAALYPQTLTKCLNELAAADSFGGLAPSQLFPEGADLSPGLKVIARNDPDTLRIGGAPVLVQQGEADTTVLKAFTDQLVPILRKRGTRLTYQTFPEVDHVGILNAGAARSTTFLTRRFK